MKIMLFWAIVAITFATLSIYLGASNYYRIHIPSKKVPYKIFYYTLSVLLLIYSIIFLSFGFIVITFYAMEFLGLETHTFLRFIMPIVFAIIYIYELSAWTKRITPRTICSEILNAKENLIR